MRGGYMYYLLGGSVLPILLVLLGGWTRNRENKKTGQIC